MTVTVGQLTQAAQAIGVDLSAANGLDLSNLAQDAVLGEDVLATVAIFWPPAALLEYALAIAVAVAPFAAAFGIVVTPDPEPQVDAQTTQSRGGRNG